MRTMTDDEWAAFLRTGTRTGKLALTLRDGRPTVTPIWFTLDDDGVIRFNTGGDTPKARSLARDPRACLIVDQEEPPYAFVRVDAVATLVDDDELTRRVATTVGGRYMGADRAEEFGDRNGVPGEITVELRPTRVVALDDISG